MLVMRIDICSLHVKAYKMKMVSKISLTVETGIVLIPYFSYWISWYSLIHKEMLSITSTWISYCVGTHYRPPPCLNKNRGGENWWENDWANREGKFQSGYNIHNCCGTMVFYLVTICQLYLFNKMLIGQ